METNTVPQFESALSFARVRDYAYPEFHPLHYGVRQDHSSDHEQKDRQYGESPQQRLSGPPWQEDDDLISRGYEASITSADEIHGSAIALFDFVPENDNEAPLKEGQIIWVSYRHGQGWLVAEDPETGETGLVPEEYVEILPKDMAPVPQSGLASVPESDLEHQVPTIRDRQNNIYDSPEWIDDDDTADKMERLDLKSTN